MIKKIYLDYILKYPKVVLSFLLVFIIILGYFATKLEIDASSDTIILENDSDLLYSRLTNKDFKTNDFLIIAFSPKNELLSNDTLKAIKNLSNELLKLSKVQSITSILNVPILYSSNIELQELLDKIPTLSDSNISKEILKKEFLTNPLYSDSLVSKDFKTTAIIINLKPEKIIDKKNPKYKELRDLNREKNHQFIAKTRAIIEKYKNKGKLFLGGVNMISDDLVTFVKNDLIIFGTSLSLLLAFVLWFVFRELRWVVIPIFISLVSIVATSGLLGLFGWEVTVISSNFISLQLIITLSIVLHLVVRYRELVQIMPNASQKELVLQTVLSKISPSFFAVLTTIIGFSSLMFSNILPVINLGWMMSAGIAISLMLSFILFPTILLKLDISKPYTKLEEKFSPTKVFANLVEKRGNLIILISIFIAIFSVSGAKKLIVENSFINYFVSSTEIYKGMKVIDEKLGGTTPLDIVVEFKEEKKQTKASSSDDEFSDFDDEFDETKDKNQYWFTPNKIELIKKVHNYLESKDEIGKVQSFATLLEIGRKLNKNKELDSFSLALIYNKLPQKFRKIVLEPYINIYKNKIRFSTRIIDSNPKLRRDKLIKEINKDLAKIIDPKTATFRQTNLMILYNNMLQSLFKSQIITLGFVLILLFMMFWITFKSFKIALIAITTNTLSIGVIFGFMGWFEIPLDMMTITIAAISMGIGVDDTIHYIHRFYEELKVDNNFTNAMKRSHESIGYAMYYTSFAIILGFCVLVLSNFLPTIYFGLLTVIAMFFALLGALLLLPRLLIVFKPRL
ncbi:efflux RND transporter permease subunit [Sulfurospirillum sp. 1307]